MSIEAICLGPSGLRLPSQAGGSALFASNEGSRGALRPGKSQALRGAGVYGAWGAKVATSTAKGVVPVPSTKDAASPLRTSTP